MVRVWKKRPEQCQCGSSLPSLVDGVGNCRGCGRSVEGRMMLGAKSVPSCFAHAAFLGRYCRTWLTFLPFVLVKSRKWGTIRVRSMR